VPRKPLLVWWSCVAVLGIQLLLRADMGFAKDIGKDPPKCPTCPVCGTCAGPQTDQSSSSGTSMSRTEGNLTERIGLRPSASSFGRGSRASTSSSRT
jgi:hypothetical protein